MVSAPRVSFSGRHLELADVEQLHSDTVASMRQYFSVSNPEYASRFNGYSTSELAEELHESIEEHERAFSMSLLGNRASLEDEILEAWRDHADGARQVVSELRGAFKYRHWLAHGRYWVPKLGRKFDYHGIHLLAQTVFDSFPFEGD